VLEGMTMVEMDFIQRAGSVITPPMDSPLPGDSLYIVLEGCVQLDGKDYLAGSSFGAQALLHRQPISGGSVQTGTRLLRLTLRDFDTLSERYPRLGLKLYRNLAAKEI
jgi:CRP-like cAMP-binding protein